MKLYSILTATVCLCFSAISAQASELTDAIDKLNNTVDSITETLQTVSDEASANNAAKTVVEKAAVFVADIKNLQSISSRLATGTPEEQAAGQQEMVERAPAIQKSIMGLNGAINTLKEKGLLNEDSELLRALQKMNPNL